VSSIRWPIDAASRSDDLAWGGGGPFVSRSQLIGRDAELGLIERLLEESGQRGHSVVVRGDPGVGKSALLQETSAMARAAGARVLEVSGIEGEAMPPFSGLDRLLRTLLSSHTPMPAVQRRALMTAFNMQEGPPPELFLIALAALTLIVSSASEQQIVLIVDDVQWIDAPTTEVLSFVSRRIQDDPVFVVFGLREGHDTSVVDDHTYEIRVSRLASGAARELLDGVAPDLTDMERRAILEHAEGNPLALVELPTAWRSHGSDVLDTPAGGVPLTTRLEHTFAARVRDLPTPTRDALLVAAIAADGNLQEVEEATKILTGIYATELLEPAEETGLVRLDDLAIRFRHPLVRSAVLSIASPQRQRAAHAALSAALPPDSYLGIFHHALAVEGYDDDVANDLEESAVVSVKRGSVITAVASIERAAELTTDSRRRGRRLLLAAKYAFGLGRAEVVGRLVAAAEAEDLSELDTARAEWLREAFSEGELGDSERILELCGFAARSEDAGDSDLALDLLASAALRCWWAVTGQSAHDRVVEVAESLSSLQDDPRCIAVISVAHPVKRGAQTLSRLNAVRTRTVSDPERLLQLGMAARALGAEAQAADYFDMAESELRKQGRLGLLLHVLAIQPASLVDLGDWRRAEQSLEDARRLARDTGQPPWGSGAIAVHAVFSALSGDSEGALDRAAQVEAVGSSPAINDWLSLAQLARGISHLNVGDHASAFATLKLMFDPQSPRHHWRQQFSGIMFMVEAAVACDAADEARLLIDRLETTAGITPSPILAVHLLYARAMLAEDTDAEWLYRHALEQDLTRWPWPRARIQLAYGNWLRRRRRPTEAREPLRAALGTFELIGAPEWIRQSRAALRATGEVDTATQVSAISFLSPQELQIATLAAQGLSNRQIGERLYLSPRTVGSHLYRIFPKLGVSSRAQIATRLQAS
jgi:DNA-binding CsgD family transcriptional regulator/tetratricopeptide (TPR) repeat protein